MKREPNLHGEQGQTLVEYLLLIFILVTGMSIFYGGLKRMKFADKIMAPLQNEYQWTYKYGHPLARGLDEGTVKYHPRLEGEKSLRVFGNPVPR